MAANMWKNSLKNVESDKNKVLYKNLLESFLQRNGTYFLNKACTYDVKLSRVRATIAAVEKQYLLHNLSVCL